MNLMQKLEFEGLRVASMSKRIKAFLIDDLIVSVLVFFISFDSLSNLQTPDEIALFLSNIMWQIVLLRVSYHSFFTWYYGASLGKMAVKIMIVDIGLFAKPNIFRSILRSIIRAVSESCFFLGFFWAFGNSTHQSWEDKAAGTVVIDVS